MKSMNTNILATATRLSDEDLLARLQHLAANEREATAQLVAHLAPRRDVLTSVRKLPTYTGPPPSMVTPAHPDGRGSTEATAGAAPAAFLAAPRPVIQPTAPQRYRVQFTIGQEAHERLRR